ncbi:MAG: 1-deoxy-D-xylulose-5-phosphate reductoisomerase [Planctomycetes bacterium]|nr:1-deoxy-D-xylulose-5-phosphate reductoisomerase [Planctomycetota bacterium]
MKKRMIILGSTGSIGKSTIEVADGLRDEWEVVGLAAGSSAVDLAAQADKLRPGFLAIADEGAATELERALSYAPTVFSGEDALVALVDAADCECVVSAVVGTGGLKATLRAVELGRRVALANKEALVIAGSLVMPLAARTGATVIPVDSEHSAVFQALQAGRTEDVRRIHLTASGGPFRTWSFDAMESATVEDALRHPTWNMGPKITIDSATMMNKALEIVEAKWLFGLGADQIDVVIHPESIVHSVVEFRDGSMIAQMGTPDMRTPIQYALTYPARRTCPVSRLDLPSLGQLNFEPPDPGRFPAIELGHAVARRGGTAGAVLNAANETAVELFRAAAIGFLDIARHVERALDEHDFVATPGLSDLLEADRWARGEVARCTAC